MSLYNHKEIEKKWQKYWAENKTFKVEENREKPKFYVLDMFPYPSGSGLHVGHPLGYIASDVFARYKNLNGYNVLHPMGYDSFGLPAEQYAIQTGQHPATTTTTNIEGGVDKEGNKISGYRKQLDKIGFSFDWDREIRTSSPDYYKWTQWIFKEIYNAWYNKKTDKAEPIKNLINVFEKEGNINVSAATEYEEVFSSNQWKEWSEKQQNKVLMNYRLTYLSDTWVNWCPELGTVLANDEIKDGVSERGGYPVEQKKMRQWSMRITAYADRLLRGLEELDWSDSIKDIQKNWIGKSKGASISFSIAGFSEKIEVFPTRPDTIFGVSFMVLAPEHPLVDKITTKSQKHKVEEYQLKALTKSERDRLSDVKTISGEFTGAYAIHPFSGKKIQIWIGDYVLASYGTGAVMAVPCGDQRDWDFAKHFQIEIKNIFKEINISESAYIDKDATIVNSDFLDGLSVKKAIKLSISELQNKGIGKGKTQYKLRDAVFSRQRYWGEPFPVYYKDDIPYVFEENKVVELPEINKYLPTEKGDPPLARAEKEKWNISIFGDRMEYNTMPGWAGSSWYFIRYVDPKNSEDFASSEKIDYWQNVDLYIGGAEHATGHLLYSRFWSKILFDLGHIPFQEPFQKLINQGMIQGNSALVYRDKNTGRFISKGKKEKYQVVSFHVDINFLNGDILDIEKFKKWRKEYNNAEFVFEDSGEYICGREIDKMSKSKYNVQTPDDLVEKYGADTLRCYEMFLGPLEQHKPWDVQGITGVQGFLKKLWKLFHKEEVFMTSNENPTKEELKTLHKTIKKIKEDIERYSFNTPVSAFMICVNELTAMKCNKSKILKELLIILSPYAPHICEELWEKLGNTKSITTATFPEFNPEYLIENNYKYPVSFNGKMRFTVELPINLNKEEIEKEIFKNEKTKAYLKGVEPKRVIVVPKKIVNIVY
ncbi:MAG: leucine--tRNA ligase [Crocinitomicaceae bacterium]|nr:leucine--tRNA ligase [Crocinitomicaceae bacterium]